MIELKVNPEYAEGVLPNAMRLAWLRARTMRLTRRNVLLGASGLIAVGLSSIDVRAQEEAIDFIERLTGHRATPSGRLRLLMPAIFPNGYTVPLTLEVDTPMTERDHVKNVRIFAPKNPINEVVGFHFAPLRIAPRVSTRIRLAAPQNVIAVAEMNDGAFLMTQTFVKVATNGCV
jgi:sulfur-oxidizing protein SoxY